MTHPEPQDLRATEQRKRRPASQWAALLIVWGIGLLVWTMYIVAFLYLFFRFVV